MVPLEIGVPVVPSCPFQNSTLTKRRQTFELLEAPAVWSEPRGPALKKPKRPSKTRQKEHRVREKWPPVSKKTMEPALEFHKHSMHSAEKMYDNACESGDADEDFQFTGPHPHSVLAHYDQAGDFTSNSQGSFQVYDHYQPHVHYESTATAAWMTPTVLVVSVFVGTLLGVGLAELKVPADVTTFVAIPGNVFLGLLKCLVLPMVFVILASGVANIVLMGKVSSIGSRATALFVLFSTMAATIATTNALILKSLLGAVAPKPKPVVPDVISAMFCGNDKFIDFAGNSSISCSVDSASANTTQLRQTNTMTWVQIDHDVFKITGAIQTWGVFEQVENILHQLMPSNIFDAFGNGILLSVITFAIGFGAAILSGTRQAKAMHASRRDPTVGPNGNPIVKSSLNMITGESKLFELINQLNQIFYFIVTRLVVFTPLAIVSLVASSLSVQKNLVDTAEHVLVFVVTGMSSVITHELLFIPFVFWFFTRQNPYTWLKQMIPCAAFAFGSASSLVTLPITIRCVENTKQVSRALMRFVLTLGCTVHMNGSAMFYPTTIVFLAATSGRDLHFGVSEIVVLILVSALSSIATPPIPNGQLVMVYSVWTAVFPREVLPDTFSYVVGIIWLEDRYETMCNVLGDTYVARIVAEYVDETVAE